VDLNITVLPHLNALLNATSGVFLVIGYVLIRRGHEAAHKRSMIAALICSAAFLMSYVIYHLHAGSRPFPGTGAIRGIYFAILITHVVLAAAILPLVLMTAMRGFRSQFDRHVRIARWTLPLWLYVSVTGVIVYVMLYQLY
jgi:putative membrane protein